MNGIGGRNENGESTESISQSAKRNRGSGRQAGEHDRERRGFRRDL